MNETKISLPAQADSMHWRKRLHIALETPLVQRTIIAVILLNAIILGLETVPAIFSRHGDLLTLLVILFYVAAVIGWPLLVSGGQVKTCPAVGRDSAGPPRCILRQNRPARGVQPVEVIFI
jgi:hypothetical protein